MDIVSRVKDILKKDGIHAALRFLNSRTPHRFTGIYRYESRVLRNVYLFDQFDPSITQGQDVPMVDAYCANVGCSGEGIEFSDIKKNKKLKFKSGSPVISYCGALIRDSKGKPYGTLCHYDIKPCEEPVSDLPLLEEIAPIIYKALIEEGQPVNGGEIVEV